jgi:hypothetical protein
MQDAGYGLPRTPLLLGTWVNRRCILRHWTKLPLPTLGSNTYIYEKNPKAPLRIPVLPARQVIPAAPVAEVRSKRPLFSFLAHTT